MDPGGGLGKLGVTHEENLGMGMEPGGSLGWVGIGGGGKRGFLEGGNDVMGMEPDLRGELELGLHRWGRGKGCFWREEMIWNLVNGFDFLYIFFLYI